MKYTFLESSDDTLLEKIYQFMWRGTPKNRWGRGVTASRCVSVNIYTKFSKRTLIHVLHKHSYISGYFK